MEWTPSRIRLLRTAGLCLSQQQFATALGFAKRTIGNAERGAHPPSLAARRALDQALEQASDAQRERFFAALATDHPTTAAVPPAKRPTVSTVEQVEELLAHLRAQWHLLVKTDNLFGPRYALSGALLHVQLLEELLVSARASARTEFVTLAAQYAESAAWLYEDSGDLAAAQTYNSRAMEWAHEAGDHLLLAWTLFRRSQQATYRADAASVVGLSQAARRNAAVLTPSMRAAIATQEAHGYALDGGEAQAQRLFDQPEQAACIAREALQIAHGVGSARTVRRVQAVGRRLTPYRGLAPVGQLLDELVTIAVS